MNRYKIPEFFNQPAIDGVKSKAAEFASAIDAIKYIRASLCIPLKDAKDFYFAEVDRATIDANARKLRMQAAAPELLAALEAVCSEAEHMSMTIRRRKIFDAARAAITKATQP